MTRNSKKSAKTSVNERWWVPIVVALIALVGVILPIVIDRRNNPPPAFDYQVRVQSDSGANIPGAKVTIEAGGVAPIDDFTDANGLALIRIDTSRAGEPARLIVEAPNYQRRIQNINLVQGELPNIVPLMPAQSIASVPTPTSTLTAISTPTARQLVSTPNSTPSPTNTTISPSPTPLTGLIPFRAPNNASQLNPVFRFVQGGSVDNTITISDDSDTLILSAAPYTDQWIGENTAPLVTYSIQGDFVAQVRVEFTPSMDIQAAGLGVRSSDDPKTFLRIKREFHNEQAIAVNANREGAIVLSEATPESSESLYLQIKKLGGSFTLCYSSDGRTWKPGKENYPFELPNAEIFLVVLSNYHNQGAAAQFSEFRILSPDQALGCSQ